MIIIVQICLEACITNVIAVGLVILVLNISYRKIPVLLCFVVSINVCWLIVLLEYFNLFQ